MRTTLLCGLLALLILPPPGYGAIDPPALRADHPEQYTVKRGDTLWGISSMFLQDPWRWPDIWQVNPEIPNPHLILPGDSIRFHYVDGQPRIAITRGPEPAPQPQAAPPHQDDAAPQGVLRLEPRVYSTALPETAAIPTVADDILDKFLQFPRVVDKSELGKTAYVLSAADNKLISASKEQVHARGLGKNPAANWSILRQGKAYVDPDNKRLLGYEALHIGEASVARSGDPAVLDIVDATHEVRSGDRLVPTQQDTVPRHFLPHVPDQAVRGKIISILDGNNMAGQYQIVVLNVGLNHGLEVGHVLMAHQQDSRMKDHYTSNLRSSVTVPGQRLGSVMIIRPFAKVSYALVMESLKELRVKDSVSAP
ncbi:MAG: LysM peptidoglycan-binding domain-containing protein [Gammaproteobacteria bacterium]|nr:LysM peptidoglycan-binding domain-containing protein [Gammaproteobacteria bacterium]